MRPDAQAKLWRQTMGAWPRRSLVAMIAIVGILLAGMAYLTLRWSAAPRHQTDICSTGYAQARTAAESSLVDARVLGSYRSPFRWTCRSERVYLGRRAATRLPN